MPFPATRLRRMRQNESLRTLVRETRLAPTNFIYPLFVCPGQGVRKAIGSMPGVFNLSVDEAVEEAREAKSLGLGGIILFGLPEAKDEVATGAWADDGIVQRATQAIKSEVRDLVVIGDVCLCEYMSHGHCGIVERKRPVGNGWSLEEVGQATEIMRQRIRHIGAKALSNLRRLSGSEALESAGSTPAREAASAPKAAPEPEYEILNDATLEILAKTAVSLARAGVDIIAPSDMMDGRVARIRKALDQGGFQNTPILSYAAKFASGFYGPFREAADSAPEFGDRRSYQMDGGNLREAMREIALDIEEGTDMIMVKPAMPYLDVIAEARRRFDLPVAAYQVSGEYAMLEAAIDKGWLERDRVMLESLQSIRRAGAQIILTYFAKEAARLLA